jgi:dihydroorotate dehydrogenase
MSQKLMALLQKNISEVIEMKDWKAFRNDMIKMMFSFFVITSIMGHGGSGFLPFMIYSKYREFVKFVRENGILVISKSATLYKRIGNFVWWKPWTWRFIQMLGVDSMLNAFGLTNGGAWVCAKKILKACQKGFNVIPSYFIEFKDLSLEQAIGNTLTAIWIYRMVLGRFFWAIEFNLSCPNSGEDLSSNMTAALECIKDVRLRYPQLVIIVKVGVVHPYSFVKQLERIGVDVIHAINTVPFNSMYKSKSPLQEVSGGGGVSGGKIRKLSFDYSRGLRENTNMLIVMAGGINKQPDAELFMSLKPYSLGTCTGVRINTCTFTRTYPDKTTEMIKSYPIRR